MKTVCTSPATPQNIDEMRCPMVGRVAVLGAGAWGTALATALQRSGSQVMLWTRQPELVRALCKDHHNARHLPGIALHPALRATTDLVEAVSKANLVILALPSTALRETALRAAPHLADRAVLLVACKGFEQGSGSLPTMVLDECCGPSILLGALSGPSFADEVARGLPTRLTLALPALAPFKEQAEPSLRLPATLGGLPRSHRSKVANDALLQRAHAFALSMRRQLANAAITLELTDDAIATQVGGAMKNLVAIACGMATAQRLGENARAAIVTLGLDDMRRLTLALGGRSQTLLGSCGVGDLFLTAASSHSRNTRLGLRLGSAVTGETMDDNPAGTTAELAEGAIAALSVLALEHRLGLRLHVAVCVRDVLLRQSSPAQALAQLLQHSPGQTLPEPKAAAPDWRGGLGFGQVRPGTGAWSQRPSHRGFPSW